MHSRKSSGYNPLQDSSPSSHPASSKTFLINSHVFLNIMFFFAGCLKSANVNIVQCLELFCWDVKHDGFNKLFVILWFCIIAEIVGECWKYSGNEAMQKSKEINVLQSPVKSDKLRWKLIRRQNKKRLYWFSELTFRRFIECPFWWLFGRKIFIVKKNVIKASFSVVFEHKFKFSNQSL